MPRATTLAHASCGILLLLILLFAATDDDRTATASHSSSNSNYGSGGTSACYQCVGQHCSSTRLRAIPADNGGACREVENVPTDWDNYTPVVGYASIIDARVRPGDVPDQVFLTAFPTNFSQANKKASTALQIDNETNAVGTMGESW